MRPDLTYTVEGLFTRFLPLTEAGEEAWRGIAAATDGTGKVLTMHLTSTLRQLKAAGYTVRKAKARKLRQAELDALLAEIEHAKPTHKNNETNDN